jgi:hypothetical protein
MAVVALVTADSERVRTHDVDTAPLATALDAAGVETVVAFWDDTAVDWSRFDLTILRSPWDYTYRLDEFLAWLDRASPLTRIANPPQLIRWNLDKRYLADLAAHGASVVPTRFCTSIAEVADALTGTGTPEVVLKPTVSAGSRDTGLFRAGDPHAAALAAGILDAGKTVMVQPAVPSVARHGERALLHVDGQFSHAISKGPLLALGGGLLGGDYREVIAPVAPTDAEQRVAMDVMRAIAECMRERGMAAEDVVPLYARLDLVALDDGPALLEAELFEPQLFFRTSRASVDRYVAAVLRRLAGARHGVDR